MYVVLIIKITNKTISFQCLTVTTDASSIKKPICKMHFRIKTGHLVGKLLEVTWSCIWRCLKLKVFWRKGTWAKRKGKRVLLGLPVAILLLWRKILIGCGLLYIKKLFTRFVGSSMKWNMSLFWQAMLGLQNPLFHLTCKAYRDGKRWRCWHTLQAEVFSPSYTLLLNVNIVMVWVLSVVFWTHNCDVLSVAVLTTAVNSSYWRHTYLTIYKVGNKYGI